MPDEKEPVILSKTETEDLDSADIGCLVINAENSNGWFIDGNGDNYVVIAIESRNFWIPLFHKGFFVPEKSDEELAQSVIFHLEKLALYEKKFIRLSYAMIKSGKGLYGLDYYISGIVSRVLSLLYGFDMLIKASNYVAAAHLVRPHLDNYLRLYAAWLSDKPHEFATAVWAGKPVNQLKDSNGVLMTDSHLKRKAVENHPWIKDVYDETSGFIHFSNKHIAIATSLSSSKERTLGTHLSKTDHKVSNHNRLEAIFCMIEISNSIAELIFGYVYTKRMDG
ncbi:MAG: hypothetical protein V4721_06935 [Bacteroidota bacterium]